MSEKSTSDNSSGENALTLNAAKVEGSVDPRADAAQLVIHGDDSEIITVNLTAEMLLQLSIHLDQMALNLEAARYLSQSNERVQETSPPARETPCVVPVHLVQELNTLATADDGCLLEVKVLQGEQFRFALRPDHRSSLLSSLLPAISLRSQ